MSQAIASARNRRAFNTPSTAQQAGNLPSPVSTRHHHNNNRHNQALIRQG